MIGPTHEQWLAALRQEGAPAGDAMTLAGWSDRMHTSINKTRNWVRAGLENGWMELAVVVITELTGKQQRRTGFRVVEKPKKVGA